MLPRVAPQVQHGVRAPWPPSGGVGRVGAEGGGRAAYYQVGVEVDVWVGEGAHDDVVGGPRTDAGKLHQLAAHIFAVATGGKIEVSAVDGAGKAMTALPRCRGCPARRRPRRRALPLAGTCASGRTTQRSAR
ncbi:MAG: hypothetical protein WKF83_11760 [Nocardioidaceae bacterium]